MNLEIFGIFIPALVFGIVEAFKEFGVGGNIARLLALLTAFILMGTAVAIEEAVIAESVIPYLKIIIFATAGALAAMGYYDWQKRVRAD